MSRNTLDCLDCEFHSYCRHAQMSFCDFNGQPAWMARDEFYDPEIEDCSKKSIISKELGSGVEK